MQPHLYWLDADPLEPEVHPTLIGETTTDLCIVGAGYTGLWTALLAKEANPERNVIIIEQLETGAGASGRNGGFCSYSLTHGFMNGYSRFKDEMAIIERLGRENLEGIEATIKKYKIDCDFELTGEISVANEEWQMEGIIEEANLRNSFGDSVEVLSKEEMQSRVNSPLSVGGLWDPDGTALVDPARLVWGLEHRYFMFRQGPEHQVESDIFTQDPVGQTEGRTAVPRDAVYQLTEREHGHQSESIVKKLASDFGEYRSCR